MNHFEENFERKVGIRKATIRNMGNEKSEHNGMEKNLNNQTQAFFPTIDSNLREADETKFQDGYFPIMSHRKWIGKLIVFIKKAMRKLKKIFWGWYWFPIFNRQSFFNGKIINTLTAERDLLLEQERTIADLQQKLDFVLEKLNVTCDLKLLEHKDIDYLDFENHFRGPRDAVKKSQSNYTDYFRINGGAEIVDIGCGRGEFLELMQDCGIVAHGVDVYPPFVQFCRERGFRVDQADALTYLSGLENNSVGGIFMSQVVEHLTNDYILSLIETAYRKLKTGCYFILETPNPDCLAAISEFNIDISHIKPIHYKSLEYFFQAAHFESVEEYHTPQCKYPLEAVHLQGKEINNLEEFNEGIDSINHLVFGYRDYTLIARK